MNKTKIEWTDFTWNPITGCKRDCFYCYGKRIQKRFHPSISWNKLVWHEERLEQPLQIKKPSKIFVGSMSDIEYWREIDIKRILEVVRKCPQHIFQFLTKNGEAYNGIDFPKNCWLGVTDVGFCNYKFQVKNQNVLFLSLEPLLFCPDGLWLNSLIKWVIIGAMTGPYAKRYIPQPHWVKSIVAEADQLKIPVFMKGSLKNIWGEKLRQDFPAGLN